MSVTVDLVTKQHGSRTGDGGMIVAQLVLGVVFVVGGIALTYRKWPRRFAAETAEARGVRTLTLLSA